MPAILTPPKPAQAKPIPDWREKMDEVRRTIQQQREAIRRAEADEANPRNVLARFSRAPGT